MSESSGGIKNDDRITEDTKTIYNKLIVAFVALSSYYIINLIDITSRHFAVAFNIPIHNIGGGDRGGKNDGLKMRMYVGTIFFSLALLMRVVVLFVLYKSSQLSFYVYIILSFESLVFGVHNSAFLGLVAEYISVSSLMFNTCRISLLLFQFVLDRFFYSNPLLMIKTQFFTCVIFTCIAVVLWAYFNFYLKPMFESSKYSNESKDLSHRSDGGDESEKLDSVNSTKNFGDNEKHKVRHRDGLDGVIMPVVLIFFGSLCKDFLTPGTLPYALLPRDKCHMINMCIPIFYTLGPLLLFIVDNVLKRFKKWEWFFNWFTLFEIPLYIIFSLSIMAIHSRIPFAIAIRNSRFRVMIMTLVLIFFASFFEQFCFICIGKYAFRGNPNGYTIQAIFIFYALLNRSIFARFSVGYTDTRISLGYHLPKFRPKHRMSKKNLGWYIFKNTFKKAWEDCKGDFKMDIKKYL